MENKGSILALEQLVVEHRDAEAIEMVWDILQTIDRNYGRLSDLVLGPSHSGISEEKAAINFATRFAAAFGYLMTDPKLEFSPELFERLIVYHRWIDLIFSLSGFHSSDNFLSLIATDAGDGRRSFADNNLLRFLAMFTMNSAINIDFDQLWRANRAATAVACLNYVSSRYVFSRRGLDIRERLLEWLPTRLPGVKLGTGVLRRLPEMYMHCSYAFTAKKHAIKRPLMEQMRRACLEAGVVEPSTFTPAPRTERATVVVVGEKFYLEHVNFRCFSPAVRSLRRRFNVIGIVSPDPAETPIKDYFDEYVAIPGDFLPSVRTLATEIIARKPALIWYLGVGPGLAGIALASLRLAPIQCASIGHNASTMSPMMDYFILPADWVGSSECFSENIIALPKAAMPFSPRLAHDARRKDSDGIVRVAICASTMKLNPVLFDTIGRIAKDSKRQPEFHFFVGFGIGLAYFELLRVICNKVPHATAHPHSAYDRYMKQLAQCDMFLSPFPHGGMTSILDAFQLGIPGICLDGLEPHAHADAAMFARISLPQELVAKSLDEYVAAAVRLIDDENWRHQCAEIVRNADLDDIFFSGDARQFCKAIEDLIWPSDNTGDKKNSRSRQRTRA
jgi:hypothetical protein